MTAVAPMPVIAPGSADIGRPGQQLMPGYVVKLLKTLKIPFGTDRSLSGVDVDPTVNLIGHIFDCIGALRDINKVYRAKGSLVARSVGTRVLFGLTAELGNILLDAITFDPPADLIDATVYYGQVAGSILTVFPEIAAQITPSTGKVLLHHTALRASSAMAMEALKMVLKAFPAGAWTADRTGALPLHWMTHNPHCSQEMVAFLVAANPKSPWVADVDGYLPLHWAVNQDEPNVDVVAALIAANASAAAKPCIKGSLPVHWAVNREGKGLHMGVLRALLQVHPDGARTFDKAGWLPLHQLVNRANVSMEGLRLLLDLYPHGLQCPNGNGQLPLHRCLDQATPCLEAVHVLLEAFPGGAKVADDEGYLPLHLALDCARPSPELCSALLEVFPEAAFHKSRDGLLPLHCLISALQPSVEAVQLLLSVFPEAAEAVAVDLIPADEMADPEGWTGDWLEKRWTPLSRAIDRGLDAIVVLFRDALHRVRQGDRPNPLHSSPPLVAHNTINTHPQQGGAPNMVSTATNRNLPPQQGGRPPLHAPVSPRSPRQDAAAVAGGAAVHTGSGYDHAGSHSNAPHHRPVTAPINHAQGNMVLGGQLDMTVADPSQLVQGVQSYDNAHPPNSHGKPRDMRPVSAAPSLANRMAPGGLIVNNPKGDRDRDRGERGDRDRERDPRDGRSREKDRDRERGGDRGGDRDRDRERRREPSRDRNGGERGQSRDREASRERGHKHRSSSRHRSSDRGGGGDRDREYRSSDRDRDRDRDRRRQSRGSYNDNSYFDEAQEDDPNYDSNSPVRQNNFMSTPSNYNKGSAAPPTSAPPRSLLEAAINRPFSRTNTGVISHDNGSSGGGGQQKDFRNSRDEAEYASRGQGNIQLDMAGFTGNVNDLNLNGGINPGYHSPDELV